MMNRDELHHPIISSVFALMINAILYEGKNRKHTCTLFDEDENQLINDSQEIHRLHNN